MTRQCLREGAPASRMRRGGAATTSSRRAAAAPRRSPPQGRAGEAQPARRQTAASLWARSRLCHSDCDSLTRRCSQTPRYDHARAGPAFRSDATLAPTCRPPRLARIAGLPRRRSRSLTGCSAAVAGVSRGTPLHRGGQRWGRRAAGIARRTIPTAMDRLETHTSRSSRGQA